MTRIPKRPRDTNQLAKRLLDLATGETRDEQERPVNGHAAIGRKGGLKGGKARADALTPEQRKASAKKAALARWNKG